MNREIKFRAWLKPRWDNDDESNKMYYDVQNSFDTLGDVKPDDPMDDFKEWLEEDAAIVEQYTGLKDKNGKEIYEGDILREYDEGLSNVGKVEWDEHNAGFCVIWSMYDIDTLEEGQFTVIGNIHENPELLEEAK